VSTFLTLIQYSTGISSQRIRQKKIKRIQIWKEEVKLFLFLDGIILHLKDPKESTKKKKKPKTKKPKTF
jgi:hypothetical protein